MARLDGSYFVARANLGAVAGLVAAGALLADYVLTVSASVASGIDAIASAFPGLTPAKLAVELGAIALITFINLRGLRTPGTMFAFPTYFFFTSFGFMLLAGLVQAIHGAWQLPSTHRCGRHRCRDSIPLATAHPAGLRLRLLRDDRRRVNLKRCAAFEGDSPTQQSRNAAQTLVVMVGLLVTRFLGTTDLAWRDGAAAHPSGAPTATSQIARFAFSGAFGWLVYVVQTATLLILVLAANTTFADFPRVSAPLARIGGAWFVLDPRSEGITRPGFVAVAGAYLLYPAIPHASEGTTALAFTIYQSHHQSEHRLPGREVGHPYLRGACGSASQVRELFQRRESQISEAVGSRSADPLIRRRIDLS